MNADQLLRLYDRVSEAEDAVPRLRRFVLDLAVRGKLVPQDPDDEPASELLKRIEKEKARLVKAGGLRAKKAADPMMGEAPFDLPYNWAWAATGAVFIYDAGDKRDPKALEKGLWLLELEDVEKDTGRLLERMTVEQRESQSTKSQFRAGDILYGKLRPYLNKVLVADETGYSTTEIVALRPYLPLSSNYCALALRRPDFVEYVTKLGQGTKMPRLRTEDAVVAPFPLPPLAEQHRIVAKVEELMALLDRIEAARAGRELTRNRLTAATLARLTDPKADAPAAARFALDTLAPLTTRPEQIKTLRQTILNLAVRGKLVPQDPADEPASELLKRIAQERKALVSAKRIRREDQLAAPGEDAFPHLIPESWLWSKVGTAVLFTEYGTSSKSEPTQSGVPVLTMGNIQDGKVIWGNEKRIPTTSEELPTLYVKQFDLLYNRTNSAELVGKTGIYLGSDDRFSFASYLIRLRPSQVNTNPTYLNIAMNAPSFRETQILPLIKKQTGQANVNGTSLKNMLLPLPPLAEQHRIVARVDTLMRLLDALEAALSAAATTRARLLDATLRAALTDTGAAA